MGVRAAAALATRGAIEDPGEGTENVPVLLAEGIFPEEPNACE